MIYYGAFYNENMIGGLRVIVGPQLDITLYPYYLTKNVLTAPRIFELSRAFV